MEPLLAGVQLDALPLRQILLAPRILDRPTVGETWWIAQKAFCDFSIMPTPSLLTLVVGNPAFSPGPVDPRFQDLKELQRHHARHVLTNGQWMTRQQIMDDQPLVGLSWQKLQLANFVGSLPSPEPFRKRLAAFELLCLEKSPTRHVVSQTYQLLLAHLPPPQTSNLPMYLSQGRNWDFNSWRGKWRDFFSSLVKLCFVPTTMRPDIRC